MNGTKHCFCSYCKSSFPINEAFYDRHERSGKTFYCPSGHGLVVCQDSLVTQLRASERCLELSRDAVSMLRKRIESANGVITRQRNRLMRGCCPYCGKDDNEIFTTDMMQHIKTRHSK